MRFLFLFSSFLCFSLSVNAQVKIIDRNGEPVRFAIVSDKQGKLIDISDSNGYVTDKIKQEPYFIKHFSLYPEPLTGEFTEKKIILQPTIPQTIEMSGSKESSDFLRIRGNFDCSQYQDSILTHEKEGIVEYLVPLKKGKIKKRIVCFNKNNVSTSATYDDVCDIPELQRSLLINYPTLDKTQNQKIKIKEKGMLVGTLFYQQADRTCLLELGRELTDANIRMLAVKTNHQKGIYGQSYNLSREIYRRNCDIDDLSGIFSLNVIHQKIKKREYQIVLYKHIYITDIKYLSKREAKQWGK